MEERGLFVMPVQVSIPDYSSKGKVIYFIYDCLAFYHYKTCLAWAGFTIEQIAVSGSIGVDPGLFAREAASSFFRAFPTTREN
jgi:hypothetical protein